jgi:hypothetical protein
VSKKAISGEESCSIRTTNELVEEGGHWKSTNKFVKKIVREEEGNLQGRRVVHASQLAFCMPSVPSSVCIPCLPCFFCVRSVCLPCFHGRCGGPVLLWKLAAKRRMG